MIQQAVLYLASAVDLDAARLRVAGRPLVFRVILAAVRAGIRCVAVPAALRSPALEAALTSSPAARASLVWLDTPAALADEPTLLLPAGALVPAGPLMPLLAAPLGSVLAESSAADAPVMTADAALLAAIRAPLASGAPIGDTLGRALKESNRLRVTGGRWYVRVTGPRTAEEAERRLYADLGSPIDTRLDIALHRRLSRPVSRAAVALGIAPNPITVANGVVGMTAAGAFALGDPATVIVGLVLYVLAVVLDHADGEVARLTLTESAFGEWLDTLIDTTVHATLVLALGIAAVRVAGGGLTAGFVAATGIIASAVVGKLWPPTPTSPEHNLLDRLSSRDGFYAMLLLFIVVRLAWPAWLPALMVIIAAGSHAYWLARASIVIRRA